MNLVSHIYTPHSQQQYTNQATEEGQKADSSMSPGSGCFSHKMSSTEQAGTPVNACKNETLPPCTLSVINQTAGCI